MAELADAPDLGSGVYDVGVRGLSPAPNKNRNFDTMSIKIAVLFLFPKSGLPQGFFGTFANKIRFIVSKLNKQNSKLSDSNPPAFCAN